MSKYGWPRCILESFIFWTVILPIIGIFLQLLTNKFNSFEVNYQLMGFHNSAGSPLLNILLLTIYILFFAGIIRASRKNLFDE